MIDSLYEFQLVKAKDNIVTRNSIINMVEGGVDCEIAIVPGGPTRWTERDIEDVNFLVRLQDHK